MQASRTRTSASYKYRIVASLVALPFLAACGYKGPLYMPPPPPQESLTVPPQAPAAAPSSADAAENSSDAAQTAPVSAE